MNVNSFFVNVIDTSVFRGFLQYLFKLEKIMK